jgi:hypothetical protein
MKFRQILSAIALSILLLVFVSSLALAAWGFAFPISVVDTGGTGRTYVPVLTGVTGSSLVSTGYMTATGTDTNMQIGSTSVPYMLSSTQIATVVPTLGTGSQATLNLYTGYTPVQTAFSIIVGEDGYITVSDVADLELGDDFEIEFDGYVDTSSGSDKDLVYKQGAFQVYVSDDEELTASILASSSEVAYSSTSDGNIYGNNANYNTAWTAVSGTVSSTDGYLGQLTGYTVHRLFLFFDTSAIPDDATVTSATLSLYGKTDLSTTDFLMTVQNGQPTYPTDPLATTDYNKAYYSDDGGSLTTDGLSTVAYNDITLNSTGESWISLTGTTKLCVRSSRDIAGTTPTGNEYVQVYLAEETGTSKDPKLTVNYTYPTKEVSVADVSSGVHTVKVYADGTNLGIILDEGEAGEVSDTTLLSGASVPDNANDIIINQNNVMPYFDYYKHTVSDTLIAWYQPVTMITGTTLPDREGTAQDATITWGSNSDLTVTMGSVTSYESSEANAGEQSEISYSAPSPNMPSGWFGGTATGLPFYDNFLQVSSSTGIPVKTIYTFMIFSVAMAVGFGVFIVFKPMIFGFIAFLVVLWAGSSMGVIPGWVIFSLIVCGFGIIYLRRQM